MGARRERFFTEAIAPKKIMNRLKIIRLGAVALMAFWLAGNADDTARQTITMEVSEMCVVDVTGSPERLILHPSTLANNKPQDAFDKSTYVQYTSTVARNRSRAMTARWGSFDSAPSGCLLRLQAIPSGGLNEGHSTGEIVLSPFDQALITGIGSCATGTGLIDGAQLLFTLTVDNVARLVPGERKTASILFTLTDVS